MKMNDNQMKPLQALELIMTRLQPSKDNIAKAKVEYETVKSALNDLTRLQELFNQYAEDNKRMREYIDMVDKTFADVETTKKKLKALEIIDKKYVDIFYIKMCFNDFFGFEHCNQSRYKKDQLTREEYELLKEVLKND